MSYIHFPIIAVMLLFLAAFLVVIFGTRRKNLRRIIAMTAAVISFGLIFYLIKPVMFDGEIISYWMGNWQPVEGYAIGIGYEIDALNLFFALLVSFTTLFSGWYSLRYMERDDYLDRYYTLYLMLSGAVLGLVLTGDLFNMFVMIEIMTFAAVALTAFRNWTAGALEASFKYLVVGSAGSSFVLAGVILIYAQCYTLNMAQISSILAGNEGLTPTTVLAFGLLFAGFGVKSYIVPFHPTAADAYTAAPSSVSMLFSGMVNKAGVYAMIRLTYVIFRAMDISAVQCLLVLLGCVTMFVGVTMALAQHDFKRLLAFHSISQIGYVITAIGLGTALGLSGGLFHAMNHTLFKGLLFLCAGAVFYAAGTTNLDKLGGLSKKMPKTTAIFLIGAFSISGLPPFNGFASKWMIYQATYEKAVTTNNIGYAFVTVVALIVSVMTLASFIKVTQSVFFGQLKAECAEVKEVPLSMRIPMWIMAGICLLSGVFYNKVIDWLLNPAVAATINVSNYIDKMMGDGYAAAAGIRNLEIQGATLSFWNPLMWLALFVVVFFAVGIVIVTGKRSRGQVLAEGEEPQAKYDAFFGGEKALPSHVAGGDLFWGFKQNWKGYFRFMQRAHSGIVNDYALWAVAATAVFIVYLFIFVH